MMLSVAYILSTLIAIAVVVQLLAAHYYTRWCTRYTNPTVEDVSLPQAVVILCLRGRDPFLAECLERLTAQDYPHYNVRVVIDHPTDPAHDLVKQWIETHPGTGITVDFLNECSSDAYLKTSAVRQCIRGLDPSVGVAVLADADSLVYREWLRDIIAPMTRTDVGVVTGNRWYDPTQRSWGSVIRYVYNAWTVIPMLLMRATWGGSLAIRRDVFDQPFFLDRMLRTACEDDAIQDAACNVDLRIEVQPEVMLLNREECTLRSCFRFVRRQLLWTRLYHPNWTQIVVGVIAVYLVLVAATILTAVAAFKGEMLAAWLVGGALLAELTVAQVIVEWLHATITRRTADKRDEPFPQITWTARLRLLFALPLTLLFLVVAVVSAAFSRRAEWRGVTYEVVPPRGIRMIEYRPYAEVVAVGVAGNSLS
ncbi:MAG: hypothetical protein CMJ64_27170 [Planctomycetaceae bacterium]|nr:hypothetical protein [Planctomycetaceae bacterium]